MSVANLNVCQFRQQKIHSCDVEYCCAGRPSNITRYMLTGCRVIRGERGEGTRLEGAYDTREKQPMSSIGPRANPTPSTTPIRREKKFPIFRQTPLGQLAHFRHEAGEAKRQPCRYVCIRSFRHAKKQIIYCATKNHTTFSSKLLQLAELIERELRAGIGQGQGQTSQGNGVQEEGCSINTKRFRPIATNNVKSYCRSARTEEGTRQRDRNGS